MDDIKTIQNDSNAAKTVALDHLGVIAARLRSSTLKFRPNSAIEGQDGGGFLRPLEEVAVHHVFAFSLLNLVESRFCLTRMASNSKGLSLCSAVLLLIYANDHQKTKRMM